MKILNTIINMIKAMRLHLSSLAMVSVLLGTSVGYSITGVFSLSGFLFISILTMLGHIAVSFSNEIADVNSDMINKNRTLFNGGTGLIIDNKISVNTLITGTIISSVGALLLSLIFVFFYNYSWITILFTGICLLFGLGYSIPPLKLSHRGLGEISAFFSYGIPLIAGGIIFQTGNNLIFEVLSDYKIYLLVLPVSISVFNVLSLTQIPDTEADRGMGKKSISVIIGPKNVIVMSIILQVICILSLFILMYTQTINMKYVITGSIMPAICIIALIIKMEAYTKPAGLAMQSVMGLSVMSSVSVGVVLSLNYFIN
jgi:1,4-dihydroxy-2-naphthoate polyprenyltransferase